MVDVEGKVELEYGRAPVRWRIWVWRGVVGVIVVGLVIGGLRYGPGVWERAVLCYWQGKCLAYEAPAGMVVCEEEPGEVVKLLADKRLGYQEDRLDIYKYTSTGRDLERVDVAAMFLAPAWKRFSDIFPVLPNGRPISGEWAPPPWGPGATIFMHERFRPDGQRRLVAVRFIRVEEERLDFCDDDDLWSSVLVPGTMWEPPMEVTRKDYPLRSRPRAATSVWPRMFAGQVDAGDRSHFTVEYEAWGQRDVLDGWLRNDDSVELVPRKRPVRPVGTGEATN